VGVNPTIRAAAAVSAVLLAAGCATTATARRPASNATAAPSPTPSYDTAGLSVLAGNTVLTRTGDRVELALPAGVTAFDATEVPAWDLSGDGRALRRVDPLGRDANGKPLPGISCLDVVALTDTLPTGRTGLCADVAGTVQQGLLSPDGTWAVLSTMDSGMVLV